MDRPGGPLHDGAALAAFVDELRRVMPPNVRWSKWMPTSTTRTSPMQP